MPRATDFPELVQWARGQDFVVTREQALTAGMPSRTWDRRAEGTLVPILTGAAMVVMAGAPEKPEPIQRARAALGTGPSGARLCLGSALRVRDIQGTPLHDPEHLHLPHRLWRARAGVQRHGFKTGPGDLETKWGMPLLTIPRSLADCVRSYDRSHAVAVLDSALHHKAVHLTDLDAMKGSWGIDRQSWLGLVDPKCESPLETRGRLLFIDHGLAWQSQVTIGAFRADFLIGEWTIVECDGTDIHNERKARHVDRKREDALRALGYDVVRLIWADIVHAPEETLRRIAESVARTRSWHR